MTEIPQASTPTNNTQGRKSLGVKKLELLSQNASNHPSYRTHQKAHFEERPSTLGVNLN